MLTALNVTLVVPFAIVIGLGLVVPPPKLRARDAVPMLPFPSAGPSPEMPLTVKSAQAVVVQAGSFAMIVPPSTARLVTPASLRIRLS